MYQRATLFNDQSPPHNAPALGHILCQYEHISFLLLQLDGEFTISPIPVPPITPSQ